MALGDSAFLHFADCDNECHVFLDDHAPKMGSRVVPRTLRCDYLPILIIEGRMHIVSVDIRFQRVLLHISQDYPSVIVGNYIYVPIQVVDGRLVIHAHLMPLRVCDIVEYLKLLLYVPLLCLFIEFGNGEFLLKLEEFLSS